MWIVSFLVSCYLTDINAPIAKAYLLKTGSPLIFTALQALEVRGSSFRSFADCYL
jgi:hypothetical protein